MKRPILSQMLGAALLALVGCGIDGKWKLDEFEPESAKGHFRLSEITLGEDGTYTAVSDYDETKRESHGTYTFEDGKLTIRPDQPDHEVRTYEAELSGLGSKLTVRDKLYGSPVVAVMKRD
jgi:major membrane immunogen (membrane-anchored lipoprotein)